MLGSAVNRLVFSYVRRSEEPMAIISTRFSLGF